MARRAVTAAARGRRPKETSLTIPSRQKATSAPHAQVVPVPRVRRTPRESDVAAVRRLAAAAGVFSRAERAIAVELIETRLAEGRRSGYSFAFAELDGRPVGYCTWGPIPMTASSWDLYWIVVDPSEQRKGIGRALLAAAEQDIARRGGTAVYVETSSRPLYAATRRFYTRAGYRRAARFGDFYAHGDDKIVFVKTVCRGHAGGARPAPGV